jgi:hypothetical protein
MSLTEFAAGIACIVATDAAKCERRSFTVCPPPPASANGSVRSLAAPAEPGVGVGTPHSYLWRQVFFTEPTGQWLCLGGHGFRFSIARTDAAVSSRVQRRGGA